MEMWKSRTPSSKLSTRPDTKVWASTNPCARYAATLQVEGETKERVFRRHKALRKETHNKNRRVLKHLHDSPSFIALQSLTSLAKPISVKPISITNRV